MSGYPRVEDFELELDSLGRPRWYWDDEAPTWELHQDLVDARAMIAERDSVIHDLKRTLDKVGAVSGYGHEVLMHLCSMAMDLEKTVAERDAEIARIKAAAENAYGLFREQTTAGDGNAHWMCEQIEAKNAEIADLSAIIKAEHQDADQAEARMLSVGDHILLALTDGGIYELLAIVIALSKDGRNPAVFIYAEGRTCNMLASDTDWRYADETPQPAPERKPRALTDAEIEEAQRAACHGEVVMGWTYARRLFAAYEAMRPSLLEGAE